MIFFENGIEIVGYQTQFCHALFLIPSPLFFLRWISVTKTGHNFLFLENIHLKLIGSTSDVQLMVTKPEMKMCRRNC